MKFQKIKQRIFDEFNLVKQADELGIKVWQTPSFLFIAMGVVIIAAMGGVYIVSANYNSPEILALSELAVTGLLFTIGSLIIKTVEEIAKANKMKTEFVSVASHQLKTPIAEINWEIELLQSKFSEGLDAKQSEIINEIIRSSEKMGRLVNDLLDVARIDQGQLALNKEKIDICALVKEAVEAQQVIAKAFNVELRESYPIRPVEIIIDRRRILVAFDNLVSNAIKYIDGHGVVEIFLEEKDGMVQVCVRDSGVGIPRSEQAKIAQKFFRSNNSIKNKTDGTGLGLYIAKNIVEQSGGSFWFKSEEGVGSEFYFTLPTVQTKKA
ncbi:MAG: Histidine kinase [Candidatus Moranbacteria bacterium GW2011_GWC2_37_8]|nr:MAG: Histidine kinase [Candidatus Moranbacteria bacterium GW2011_GWC2_37_8]KKQ63063.1 MAG: Histidine kinase [Parcubacteria group bacterium GW2011_GWC1_38_22]KKQ80399.1 MAG: Histidine kinase [Candidatus Moranbacteria bacterium GW2011_GWD2_38_7]